MALLLTLVAVLASGICFMFAGIRDDISRLNERAARIEDAVRRILWDMNHAAPAYTTHSGPLSVTGTGQALSDEALGLTGDENGKVTLVGENGVPIADLSMSVGVPPDLDLRAEFAEANKAKQSLLEQINKPEEGKNVP